MIGSPSFSTSLYLGYGYQSVSLCVSFELAVGGIPAIFGFARARSSGRITESSRTEIEEALSIGRWLVVSSLVKLQVITTSMNKMEQQAIAEARKLPIEVLDLRSVKIGGELYNLDRDIKVSTSSAEKVSASTANDGETDEQSRPAKKVKTTESSIEVPSSNAKYNETDAQSKPASAKVKTETEEERDYYLEIKWQNYGHDANDNWVATEYSMFDDEISDELGGIEMSRVFEGDEKKEEGENHQLYLTLCLVDGKSEDRKTLVEIEVYYWTVLINLMHFNILSQDLANFCRDLWKAAGRNADDYCDMAIEFGESRFSGVEICELIEEATGIYKEHVMYIEKAKLMPGATSRDAMTLLEFFYVLFPAYVIAHEDDLKSIGITKERCDAFGFQQLSRYPWFIGSIDEI